MASGVWLESSLQRSASLGMEVLKRASRRSIDWTSTRASLTPTTTDEDVCTSIERTPSELDEAFDTIAELMAQTTYQCKRFYESGCCTEPSDTEKSHMSRFHTQVGTGRTLSTHPPRRRHVAAAGEDFHIEVSPGTYAVTASMAESQRQTRLVSVKAGESVDITFNL